MDNKFIEPKLNCKLKYKFQPIGTQSYLKFDAVIIFLDKDKNLYRIKDLNTGNLKDLNLFEINQDYIIIN